MVNTPATPAPVINRYLDGAGTTNVIITWSSVSGSTYQVQYKDELSWLNWSNLTSLMATGSTTSASDTTAPAPTQRFYRNSGAIGVRARQGSDEIARRRLFRLAGK